MTQHENHSAHGTNLEEAEECGQFRKVFSRCWVWATQSCSSLGPCSAFHFVNTSTYLLVPLWILSCYSRGMILAHTLHPVPGSGHRGTHQDDCLAIPAQPLEHTHPFLGLGYLGKLSFLLLSLRGNKSHLYPRPPPQKKKSLLYLFAGPFFKADI
ncbi:hypothetical protein LEMLEM_LOCUS990 [Lemmus lemmus]